MECGEIQIIINNNYAYNLILFRGNIQFLETTFNLFVMWIYAISRIRKIMQFQKWPRMTKKWSKMTKKLQKKGYINILILKR